ncbi:Chemotaxis protein MotB [Phaeobacter sp. CECT 5382]|uniref:peptidoglycan -binding protein n=1 Tax=Phaeobacter sp. CECT 5382 TaxID=1712645 RepID=UPI0006D94BF6|nr:peptidoglycan -binding protein [Phaeobacter sp. CECT 5382]CUH89272.1 Chemotaxis protein MotB [Phaeobacter sp. CECT 5382]
MALSRRTGQRFQNSIWPGFVDAMTGLLLVLMFVLTIFMVVQFVLRETITGQESELDELATEVQALASALGLEERANNRLNARLGALSSTLSTTQEDLAQAQNAIAEQQNIITGLTAERDQQLANLAQAQQQITAFEAQVAAFIAGRDAAQAQIASLTADRDRLDAERSSLLSEQDALNLALAQARDEIDIKVEAARLAAAKREALEALIADLETEGAARQAELSDLSAKLSAEEAARLVEVAAAEALRARLETADAELTALTLSLEHQRQEAEDTLTLLAAAQVARDQLNSELEAALATLEAARAQSQERDELAERLTRVLAQMQVSQSAAEGRVAALEVELERLQLDGAATRERLGRDLDLARQQAAQSEAALEAELARQRAANVETQTQYQDELARLQQDFATAQHGLEQQLATMQAESESARRSLETKLAQLQTDTASVMAGLEAELAQAQQDLALARSAASSTAEDRATVERRLLQALEALENAQAAAGDQAVLQQRLLAALNARKEAEAGVADQRSLAEERAALLAQAQAALAEQKTVSTEAQRETALLNQQVAALREQLGGLQAILDDYEARDTAQQVQLQNLGQDLNAALARAASQERRSRLLEERERKRLEIEAAELANKAADLERYRSEFFGRLRDVLGNQDGVRIEGDRFVFASEVLFASGSADLSAAGTVEIAKVAQILQTVAAEIPPELNWIIRVDGHTDNTAMAGSAKYSDNWELSQGRALSVVRFMIENLGVAPDRLAANGFGEFQPVNPADTPQARAQNRRIELKFTER